MTTAQEIERAMIIAERSLGLTYLKINTQARRTAEALRDILNIPLGTDTDNGLFASAKLTLDDYDDALEAHDAAYEALCNLKWEWEQQEDAALNN